VAQLDTLGENLLNAGEKEAAIQVIETIIAMNRLIKPSISFLVEKLRMPS